MGCRDPGRRATGRGGRWRGGWVGRPHSRPGPASPHAPGPAGGRCPGRWGPDRNASRRHRCGPAAPNLPGHGRRPAGRMASGAGGAVDVQDVEPVAGGQADVGLGVAGPPGQDPGPVGGGVLDPVGDQAAQGVLADLAAARIPTRAARPHCGARQLLVAGEGLEVAVVGEGMVQGQDRDAAGGIAKGGVAQHELGRLIGCAPKLVGVGVAGSWRRCCGHSRRPRPRFGPSRAARPAAAGHRRPAAAPRLWWGRSGPGGQRTPLRAECRRGVRVGGGGGASDGGGLRELVGLGERARAV